MPNLFQNSSAGKIFFFCILVSICSCPYGYAQTTIKIGVYDNKPIIFVNDEGEVQGLFADLLNEIAIKENWRLEYVVGDFPDVFTQLKEGKIDILPALAYSKQREEVIDYTSETILSNWAEIYVPGDDNLTTLLELEGKKIGVIQDDIHFTALKELTDRFNISCRFIEVFEYETLFEMLQENFVHAGVVNRFYGNRHDTEYSVKRTPVIFNPIEMRFGATKNKHQDVLTKIDSYMLSYLADGHSIYYQLINKWFAVDTKKVFPRWFLYSFITVAGATLLFFGAALLFRRQVQRRTEELTNANLLLKSQIVERKKAQKSLLENEEKYRNLLESTSTVPWELDFDSLKFTYMGHQVEKMLGYSAKSWKDFNTWAERVHPEDREPAVRFCEIETKRGRNHDFIYRVTHKDGSYRWVRDVVSVVMDSGTPKKLIGFMQDITEQKKLEHEQKRMEMKLQQSQKMEAIGTLAGGIAHDFNNMLGVILGYTEMALEETDPASSLNTSLRAVQHAAEHSAVLTQQLLTFARKQTIAPKVIDINDTVGGMLNMLRRLIGEEIRLLWQPGTNLKPVKVDPSQINQLLANLCVNARDAIAGVGKITIETNVKTFDEDYCSDHLGFEPGEYVLLEVSDNGCGMDKTTLNQIFEPFFTTKEQGKGTGLGLASVFGMVKQNNGFIKVYSEPGQGTTFKIYLPAYATISTGMEERAPNLPSEQGNETILLVEDESAIMEMTSMMLTRLGYTVVAAATAGEAIRLAHEYQGRIDLLMTDVVMPEMNGRELAENLLSDYPDLKRLFMSGYTANVIAHHGVLDQGVQFIQKPFSKKDLGKKLREVLEEKDTD